MKQCLVGLIFSLASPICMAGSPASTTYVDVQFNSIQLQIDAIKSKPPIAHPVGSCYGGGVVFYVNSSPNAGSQQHGLIAAPTDVPCFPNTSCQWETSGGPTIDYITPNATYFTGSVNTQTILSAVVQASDAPAANGASLYTFAGDICADCTSWYLPAINELTTLISQSKSSIALGDTTFWSHCGGTALAENYPYWSSTTVTPPSSPSNNVLAADAGIQGHVADFMMGTGFYVRAIRAF